MDNKTAIKYLFEQADKELCIDWKKKEKTIESLKTQIDKKKVSMVYNKRQILRNQFFYMDRTILVFQLIGGIIVLLLTALMKYVGVENEGAIAAVMLLSILMSAFSFIGISRIFSLNFAELSESCYFNAKQMVAFWMVCSSVLNLTILFFLILFVGFWWEAALLQIGLYLIVPYVMAQCCCMGVLFTEFGRRNVYAVLIATALLCAFCFVVSGIPGIYEASAVAFWGIACTVGIAAYGVQIKMLFAGMDKGEMICMN